jgi:hypothetical protein
MALYIKPYVGYPLRCVVRTEPPTKRLTFVRDCGCEASGESIETLKITERCNGVTAYLDKDGNRVDRSGFCFEPQHPNWLSELLSEIDEHGIDWDAMAEWSKWFRYQEQFENDRS